MAKSGPKTDAKTIINLVRLGVEAEKEVREHLLDNEDPACPIKFKIRQAGSVFIRPTRDYLIAEVLKDSFFRAKLIGYRGDYLRWKDFVFQGEGL